MIFENDTIGFPAFSEKLYQPFSRKMEEAARYWGSSHDDLLLKLCLFIAEKKVGKDCINLLQMISDDIKDLDQLREKSQLPQNQFDSYIRKLEHEQIISFNPLEVNILSIFRTVLSPQLVNFAYENAKLREDKEYVEKIVKKVLDESTLNVDKLVSLLTTKYPELDAVQLTEVIEFLVSKGVLVPDENNNGALKYNFVKFIIQKRKEALESLVEMNDRRVLDVVKVLFSDDLFGSCLETCENTEFDVENVTNFIAQRSDLSTREITSIFDILKSQEYSIISMNENVITPSNALKSFKMKKIAELLSEIGYPLARRVINFLLRKDSVEGNYLCESLLMTIENGRELLEKLCKLGVIEYEKLQDAPHTALRRQYTIWRLSPASAINNASAYLIGVLAGLYFELQTEKDRYQQDLSSKKKDQDNMKRKKFDEKKSIIKNTIISVTKKYIEIQEL